MTLRFGTDGIRGVANVELTPELVDRARSRRGRGCSAATQPFVIGRDTRRSGPMLEAALVAGLCAEGADVVLRRRAPHARRRVRRRASAARPRAVISASHNPFADNGIKLFAPGGRKLPDALEREVEHELRALAVTQPEPGPEGLGVGVSSEPERARRLRRACSSTRCRAASSPGCTSCSTAATAPRSAPRPARARARSGADVDVIHASPDGTNINAGCGSTDPAAAPGAVRRAAPTPASRSTATPTG